MRAFFLSDLYSSVILFLSIEHFSDASDILIEDNANGKFTFVLMMISFVSIDEIAEKY